jgi:hypothetical protein
LVQNYSQNAQSMKVLAEKCLACVHKCKISEFTASSLAYALHCLIGLSKSLVHGNSREVIFRVADSIVRLLSRVENYTKKNKPSVNILFLINACAKLSGQFIAQFDDRALSKLLESFSVLLQSCPGSRCSIVWFLKTCGNVSGVKPKIFFSSLQTLFQVSLSHKDDAVSSLALDSFAKFATCSTFKSSISTLIPQTSQQSVSRYFNAPNIKTDPREEWKRLSEYGKCDKKLIYATKASKTTGMQNLQAITDAFDKIQNGTRQLQQCMSSQNRIERRPWIEERAKILSAELLSLFS